MNRQGAFTLVELMVSMAIASVLLLGMGSAMMIASRALPEAEGPAFNTIAAAEVAGRVASELQYAVAITDSNATCVEFTVADRNEDDVPETIRYQWSGTPGDSLTRQYNAGTLAEILADVRQFDLAYDLHTTTTEIPQENESGETYLAGYYSSDDLASRDVKDDRWLAQYFAPSLPADTVSWKVTRVSFYAAAKNVISGQCRLQLQLATAGGLPTGIVLGEKTLYESTLSPLFWTLKEFDFSNVSGLSPGQKLCLILKWVSGTEACQVLIRDEYVPASSAGYMQSTDRGVSWTQYSDQSLLFRVHGTVTTEGQPQVETTYTVQTVNFTLRKGDDTQAVVHAGVQLLNGPEVMQ